MNQIHDGTQDTNTFQIFIVPIGNAKNVDEMKFHIDAPMLKYRQYTPNICCFSSLESAFESVNQIKASNAISKRMEDSLTSQVGFRNYIDFANAVLKNQKIVKGVQKLYYKMSKYTQKSSFNILNDICEHFTLVQLMDSLVNVNRVISVVGYWVFDWNYEKALVLNREPLYIICAPYTVEEQVTKFETVFYSVRYIILTAQIKKEFSPYISHKTYQYIT